MNKNDLVKIVADSGNYRQGSRLDRAEAERALNAVVNAIERCLKENESVELIGFGKFENVMQKGKTGLIPGTDKKYETQDKLVPKFKPGKALKDSISRISIEK